MADEFDSTLGFDATAALKTFQLLEAIVNTYTKALKANASATGDFNTAQQASDNVLDNLAKAASGAREEIQKLAQAEQNAANAAKKVADAQKTAAELDARKNAVSARKTVLNSLPTGLANKATPTEISGFDKSLDAFQKLVTKTGTSQVQVQAILANLKGNYSGADRQIRDSILNIINANNNLGRTNFNAVAKTLAQVGAAGKKAGQDVSDGAAKATQSSTGFLLSWQSIQRFFAGQVLFRVFSQITSEINNSIEGARKLQVTLAQIQTIAPKALRQGSSADIGTFTKNLSNDFGIDQVQVATATYEAFSNQVGDTAQTLSFMGNAAKFSVAAVTSLNDAQAIGTGIINAYGLSTADSAEIFDKLFRTIDVGRISGQELSTVLGRIIPVASQLGVSLDEVLAALASLTIQGLSAEEAGTRLNNLFLRFIKPAGELSTAFDKLGVTSVRAFVQAEGFVGALEKVQAQTDGSVEELAKLIPNIRGFSGAVSLAAQNGKLFATALGEIRNNSKNASDDAFQLIQATPAKELQKSIEQLKNVFIEDFGNPAIDTINLVIKNLGGAEVAAKTFLAVMAVGGIAAVTLFGVQLVTAIGAATASMIGLATAGGITLGVLGGLAAFTGFGIIALGIGAIALAFINGDDSAKQYRESVDAAFKATSEGSKQALQDQAKLNRATEDATKANVKTIQTALQERSKAYAADKAAALNYQKSITDDLKNQVNARQKLVDRFVQDVAKTTEDAGKQIKKLNEDQLDAEFKLNSDRFDRNLNAAPTDQAKASLLQQRIAQLLDAQNRASKIGSFDRATDLNKDAVDKARELASLTGQRAKGEFAANQVLAEGNKLRDQQRGKLQAVEQQAEDVTRTLEAQQQEIHAGVDEFNDLLKQLSKAENSTDRAKIGDRAKKVASDLQDKFSNFKAPGLSNFPTKEFTDFQNQVKKLQEGFTDTSGTRVPLNLSVDTAIQGIEDKLKSARFSADVELRIQTLTGIGGGTDQIDKLKAKVGELEKTSITKSSASNALITDQGTLDTAIQKSIEGFDRLKQEAKDAGTTVTNAFGLLSKANGGPDLGATARLAPLQAYIVKVNQLKSSLQEAIAAGDPTKLAAVDSQLQNLQAALTPRDDAASTVGIIKTLRIQLEQVASSLDKVGQDKKNLNAAQEAENTITALNQLIQNLKISETVAQTLNTELTATGPAGQAGANGAAAALQSLQSQQQKAIANQQLLNQLMQEQAGGGGGGGVTEERAHGGRIGYFSSGGFVPRGTDTVPAMLSPNEFVVNAASTRKFYSQLVAMNAGVQPAFMSDGGAVHHNTFTGDVNLNLPAGSNSIDGRAATAAVRRELRRKTSKL